MADTTHRVLRLLGLLESRSSWGARELADRLGVTERTVRRDVARLRDLGYPVHADAGLHGGYRLGAGGKLPPLVLDDDEALALVACLRMAALSGADGVGEAGLRALAKLSQVLPPRLRSVVTAVDRATWAIPRSRTDVDLRVLQDLALAQRDHTVVRFLYHKPGEEPVPREVEPARMLTQGERWYLQGFDRDRDDWRVFRLDRIGGLKTTTHSFTPRPAPATDVRPGPESFECTLTVELDVEAQRVRDRIPAAYRDNLEATARGCRFRVGGPSWDTLAWHMLSVSRDLRSPLRLPEGPGREPFTAALRAIAHQASALADAD